MLFWERDQQVLGVPGGQTHMSIQALRRCIDVTTKSCDLQVSRGCCFVFDLFCILAVSFPSLLLESFVGICWKCCHVHTHVAKSW